MVPVVHVRRACADEQSEVACGESGAATGDAAVTGMFEPGTYTVFADARERESAGHYTLSLDTLPPGGSGVPGDGCGDAAPLGSGAAVTGTANGDTFAARDDVAGSCGGAGAPDVVYRLDVAKRSRFVATLDGEEATHLLVAWRRCADRSAEVACGRSIDTVLTPGSYFVAVDGAEPDTFGRFSLAWAVRDLTAQVGACASAVPLVEGRATSSTTVGAGDRFVTSCGASDAGASGADRVFKINVASRSTVRVTVSSTGFDPAVAIRRVCADGAPNGGDLEVACEADADSAHKTSVERTLEPGPYWIVVDGQSANDQGAFTIDYRVVR
jgi:hypothetical protein